MCERTDNKTLAASPGNQGPMQSLCALLEGLAEAVLIADATVERIIRANPAAVQFFWSRDNVAWPSRP